MHSLLIYVTDALSLSPPPQPSMRAWKGLRLGRRAVRLWRWVSRRRSRRYHTTTPRTGLVSLTKKVLNWGRRCLARPYLCTASAADVVALPFLKKENTELSTTPKGHLPVYVGVWEEGGGSPPRRYVVPLVYVNHPLFGELLKEAEEEFGYHHSGGITIPCPVSRFERVRTCIAAAAARDGRKTASLFRCLRGRLP